MKQPRLAAPSDLSCRLLHCVARARLFADVLGNDERTLCSDSLLALGEVADDLADELEAIEQALGERSRSDSGPEDVPKAGGDEGEGA